MVKYFSINFQQHKNYYDFFQEGIINYFLPAVYNRFVFDDKYKIQGYAEIINQQQGDFVIAEMTGCGLLTYIQHDILTLL